jgi:hypothetical protein
MEQRFNAVSLGADSESSEFSLLDEDRSTTVFVLIFSTNSQANDEMVARLLQEEYLRNESRVPIGSDDDFIEQLQLQYSRSKV